LEAAGLISLSYAMGVARENIYCKVVEGVELQLHTYMGTLTYKRLRIQMRSVHTVQEGVDDVVWTAYAMQYVEKLARTEGEFINVSRRYHTLDLDKFKPLH
jgi:hypothetical protein